MDDIALTWSGEEHQKSDDLDTHLQPQDHVFRVGVRATSLILATKGQRLSAALNGNGALDYCTVVPVVDGRK
jgi:hypothetical protein